MELPAFFFDIDGTLLDYPHGLTEISEATKQALEELRKKHPIFIASGRTKCFIDPKVLAYPFDGFVTCNGAYVEYQGCCIYKKTIPLTAIEKAKAVAKQYQAVLYLESYDHICVETINRPLHDWFAKRWGMDEKYVRFAFDPTADEAYIAMIVAKNEADCPAIVSQLSDVFDVSRHVKQNSFDLTIQKENKACGIEQVMRYFHSDLQNAWAFGDARNDLEMIQAVGHGIAMGNAVEELKALADDVTLAAWEDGIAACLKKYHWIK